MRAAIGFGMTISEFYESTPRELYNFVRGKKERLENDEENRCKHTRLIMWASLIPYAKNKINPQDLITLESDTSTNVVTPYMEQEIKRLSTEWDKDMGI